MAHVTDRKLANTVLYLLRGCPSRPGVTHLLKMLFFADYEHYRKHLTSITGADYVALERGPAINNYRDVFASFESDGLLKREYVPVQGQPKPNKEEYVASQEPDESLFSESEREILDAVIAQCGRS